MMKSIGKLFAAAAVALSLTVFSAASAGEMDILLQKLVEKKVLTQGEAMQIATETKEQVRKEIAQGKNETLPAWLQTVKLKGDFRMRYQFDKQEDKTDQNRARARVRLGTEAKVNDQVKIGVGLATGKLSDPRSTNVTFGTDSSGTDNPGSFKDIILDYAYGQYTPASWLTITGGKFKNPLWQPSDLLWDTDLNPEGAALCMSNNVTDELEIFMNNLGFVLNESRDDASDAYMLGLQPGFKYMLTDNVSLKSALAFYFFNGVEGNAKFKTQSKNSTVTAVPATLTTPEVLNYKYDYDSINPSVELGVKEPFGGMLPYAAVFADYVMNTTDPENGQDSGYDFGVKFGAEKVANAGDWNVKVLYAELEKDAFMDIFPDSDRYSGKTDMESYEAALEYGLGKNTTLGLDYYYGKAITEKDGTHSPAHVFQVDWNLKF